MPRRLVLLLAMTFGLTSVLAFAGPTSGATAPPDPPLGNQWNIYCDAPQGCVRAKVDFAGTDFGGGGCEARFYRTDDPDGPAAFVQANPGYLATVYMVPGSYKVRIGDHWLGGGSFASADPLRVSTTNDRLRLPACRHNYEASISSPNGIPILTARLVPYGKDDPTEVICRRNVEIGYFFESIGCGQKLRLVESTGLYRSQWVDGASSFWTTKPVGSLVGATMTPTRPIGSHGSDEGDAVLRGRVDSPGVAALRNMGVDVFWSDDPTGPLPDPRGGFDDDDGGFSVRGLPQGDVKVRFGDGSWFGGRSFDEATVVHVTPGDSTPPLHVVLPARGSLTGVVRSSRGDRLGGILATLRADDGTILAQQTTWDFLDGYGFEAAGSYDFRDVPVGRYTVELSDVENLYLPRFLGGATDLSRARRVEVEAGTIADAGSTALPHGLTPLLAPTVRGTSQRGLTLSVRSRGSWSVHPTTWSYAWQRDGQPVPGATRSSYRLGSADRGHRMSLKVTAHRAGFPDAVAESRQTTTVR